MLTTVKHKTMHSSSRRKRNQRPTRWTTRRTVRQNYARFACASTRTATGEIGHKRKQHSGDDVVNVEWLLVRYLRPLSSPPPLARHSVVRLPCDHLFHDDCLDKWVQNNFRCPLCNEDLRSEEEIEQSAQANQSLIQIEEQRRLNDGGIMIFRF